MKVGVADAGRRHRHPHFARLPDPSSSMSSTWLAELGPNQTAALVTPSILAEQFDRGPTEADWRNSGMSCTSVSTWKASGAASND